MKSREGETQRVLVVVGDVAGFDARSTAVREVSFSSEVDAHSRTARTWRW